MRIYLKKIAAKFHPDLIWKDGSLGYLWKSRSNNNNKKKNKNKNNNNNSKNNNDK